MVQTGHQWVSMMQRTNRRSHGLSGNVAEAAHESDQEELVHLDLGCGLLFVLIKHWRFVAIYRSLRIIFIRAKLGDDRPNT